MKIFIVCVIASLAAASTNKTKQQEKRGLLLGDAGVGFASFAKSSDSIGWASLDSSYGGGYARGYDFISPDNSFFSPERITGVTVHREVPVPVPVEVTRYVSVPHPVTVEKPYPVLVPQPVPVEVVRHVPVKVDRPYPVTVPVEVKVPVPLPLRQSLPGSFGVADHASHANFRSSIGSGYAYNLAAKKW